MMMSPLTFKEIFAATIEVCTVLLADFCVFPDSCFFIYFNQFPERGIQHTVGQSQAR